MISWRSWRSFDPSRVTRLTEDDTGRYKRRSLPARKEPRSITPLHERRKSIDLGTEAAARRPRKPVVDPIVTSYDTARAYR